MEICAYEQLSRNAGVVFHVRFIATIRLCMQSTDLEKKNNEYLSDVVKECISKGCEISHLKLPPKQGKRQRDIVHPLEDVSNKRMVDANLQVSEEHVIVSEFETYRIIAEVPISKVEHFSRGDVSSLDCIGLLVKQSTRLVCLVIQILDGLIIDDIQTAIREGQTLYFESKDSGLVAKQRATLRNSCLGAPILRNPTTTRQSERSSGYYTTSVVPETGEDDKNKSASDAKELIAYLGDLPNGTQPVDIYEWLNDFEVSNVKLDYDENNIFLGTARVEFHDSESKEKAINGSHLLQGTERRFSIYDNPPLSSVYEVLYSGSSVDPIDALNRRDTPDTIGAMGGRYTPDTLIAMGGRHTPDTLGAMSGWDTPNMVDAISCSDSSFLRNDDNLDTGGSPTSYWDNRNASFLQNKDARLGVCVSCFDSPDGYIAMNCGHVDICTNCHRIRFNCPTCKSAIMPYLNCPGN